MDKDLIDNFKKKCMIVTGYGICLCNCESFGICGLNSFKVKSVSKCSFYGNCIYCAYGRNCSVCKDCKFYNTQNELKEGSVVIINDDVKRQIYNISVGMHNKGVSHKVIAMKIYRDLKKTIKDLKHSLIKDYVTKSVYDYEIKQKAGHKDEAERNLHAIHIEQP